MFRRSQALQFFPPHPQILFEEIVALYNVSDHYTKVAPTSTAKALIVPYGNRLYASMCQLIGRKNLLANQHLQHILLVAYDPSFDGTLALPSYDEVDTGIGMSDFSHDRLKKILQRELHRAPQFFDDNEAIGAQLPFIRALAGDKTIGCVVVGRHSAGSIQQLLEIAAKQSDRGVAFCTLMNHTKTYEESVKKDNALIQNLEKQSSKKINLSFDKGLGKNTPLLAASSRFAHALEKKWSILTYLNSGTFVKKTSDYQGFGSFVA